MGQKELFFGPSLISDLESWVNGHRLCSPFVILLQEWAFVFVLVCVYCVFVNPPLSDCDNWSTLVIFYVLCTIVCNTVARLCVCVQRWPRGEDEIYYSRAAPSGERVPTTLPTSDEET